jgi:hypothetical protein
MTARTNRYDTARTAQILRDEQEAQADKFYRRYTTHTRRPRQSKNESQRTAITLSKTHKEDSK